MSRTNFDYLLQATAPIGERSSIALPRAEDALPLFDEHLHMASSAALGSSMDTAARKDAPDSTSSGSTSDRDGTSSNASQNDSVTSAANTSRNGEDSETDSTTAVDENDTTASDASDIATANSGSESNATDDSDDEDQVEVSEIASAAVESNVASAVAEVKATVEENTVKSAGEAATADESAEETTNSDKENSRARVQRLPNDHPDTIGAVPSEVHASATEVTTDDEFAKDTAAGTVKSKSREKKSDSSAVGSSDDAGLAADAIVVTVDEPASTAISGEGPRQPNTDGVASPDDKRHDAAGVDTSDSEKASRTAVRDNNIFEAVANKVAAVAVPTAGPTERENGAGKEFYDGAAPTKAIAAKSAVPAEATNRLQSVGNTAKRSAEAGGSEDLPRVDPARFVGRVAKAFQTANERGGTLQLRLSPPELGAMRIEFTVKDGVMTANLETENAAARRVLLEHLPALRERLAEQNIRVERFDVDVRSEGAGGQADPRAAQDERHPQQGHTNRRTPAERAATVQPARTTAPLPQQITTNTGINVVA